MAFEDEARRQSRVLETAAADPNSDEAAVMQEIWTNFVEFAEALDDENLIVFFVLPHNWYRYVVAGGATDAQSGIYQWHVEDVGSYIGKYTRIRGPTKEYGRNVARFWNGKPYRRGNTGRISSDPSRSTVGSPQRAANYADYPRECRPR
jgi:hypothetical protein